MTNLRDVTCQVPDCFFLRLKDGRLCEKHQAEADKASYEADKKQEMYIHDLQMEKLYE